MFAGALGFRFDEELAAAVARELPDWTLLFAGPAEPAAEEALAPLPNAVLTGAFAHRSCRACSRSAGCASCPTG